MKRNKQIVPLCILVAIILFFAITWTIIKGSIEEFNSANIRSVDAQQNLQKLQEEDKLIVEQQEKDELELRSIKPVYRAADNSDDESLSVFGGMFERLIGMAKDNGLLLRSIEYVMNPEEDTVYKDFSDEYNVCELKFFFVGTYLQLRSFLTMLTNNFEYLVSISRLNVSAFQSNTDYILINMSITLYSKKPVAAK